MMTAGMALAQTQVFLSECIESRSYHKAVEIFNNTIQAIPELAATSRCSTRHSD